MKIAYIGDIIGHGYSLQNSGTSITIMLSQKREVEIIDVFCPKGNPDAKKIELPAKIRIFKFYSYDNIVSLLKLLKIKWKNYDEIIFNMIPTGFGNSSLANGTGLLLPLIIVSIFKVNNVKLIYHNSSFTNNIKELGYKRNIDRVRLLILSHIEKKLFKVVPTYVLLNLYKEIIDYKIGLNKVNFINFRYFDAIPSLYLNNCLEKKHLEHSKNELFTILMHGSWGPQKNLSFALEVLKDLKAKGHKFKLIISGGINKHFPQYESVFKMLLNLYSTIIDDYLGVVEEKEILFIFLKADLVILPYNTPGGLSGVLEQAIFFEIPTIAMDFPEYREQALELPQIKLATMENFAFTVENSIVERSKKSEISIETKLEFAMKNISCILKNNPRNK